MLSAQALRKGNCACVSGSAFNATASAQKSRSSSPLLEHRNIFTTALVGNVTGQEWTSASLALMLQERNKCSCRPTKLAFAASACTPS
ncbi:hypothetical protein E2320_020171 [Naja naja]|nr:hypothetical protein E2320_020171 [Naja naja]